MYDIDGYKGIINVDISPVAIQMMADRNSELRPSLQCKNNQFYPINSISCLGKVMDCRKLEFADNTFDLIIDKSTADALLCGTHAFKNLAITLKECQRVLKTHGIYIAISYG